MPAGDGKVRPMQPINREYKLFRRGDFDSLPMLFFDNMSSLLGIFGVMSGVIPYVVMVPAGLPIDHARALEMMVWSKAGPGVAFALLFGNVVYAWMAFKLAGYENRTDITALPYGINTPAGYITCNAIMIPIAFLYLGDAIGGVLNPEEYANKVWTAACSVNFVAGIFEVCGCFMGDFVRKNMCKAAIYAPIAGIGFTWLALTPVLMVNLEPVTGMIPFAIVFTGFMAVKGKGIYPTGMAACLIFAIGTLLMWIGTSKYDPGNPDRMGEFDRTIHWEAVKDKWELYGGENKMYSGAFSLEGFGDIKSYVMIVFPVAIASFMETMENVEAAAHVGDHYNVYEAMVVDGLGTMIGAFFGSPVPTTVYLGHRRHKAVGAGAGYSLLNGLIFFIMLMSGIMPAFAAFIDPVSISVVLFAVGTMIVQQAFEVSVSEHYPALCVGIMFVIADWIINTPLLLIDTANGDKEYNNMGAGAGIMCSLIVTQICCDLTDLRFDRAAVYSFVAMICSLFGVMHGNNPLAPTDDGTGYLGELTVSYMHKYWEETVTVGGDATTVRHDIDYYNDPNEGYRFCIAYAMLTVFCLGHLAAQKAKLIPPPTMGNGAAGASVQPAPDGTTEITDLDNAKEVVIA